MNAPGVIARSAGPGRLRRQVEIDHGGWAGWRRAVATQLAYRLGAYDGPGGALPARVDRLVFVCLGNLNRSPFGAAAARHRGIAAVSIGLQAAEGMAVSPRTRRCAEAFGIDIAAHQPVDISDHELLPGDLLLVMEARHLRALVDDRGVPPGQVAMLGRWAAPQRLHIEDPQGRCDDYLRTCFGLIHSAVDRLADDLRAVDAACMP